MRITIKSKKLFTEEELVTVWYITHTYTYYSNCTTICLNTLEHGLKLKLSGDLTELTVKEFAEHVLINYYITILDHEVIAILEGEEDGT